MTLSSDVPICLLATAGGLAAPLLCWDLQRNKDKSSLRRRSSVYWLRTSTRTVCVRGCLCVCVCVFSAVAVDQKILSRYFHTKETLLLTAGHFPAASDLVAMATTLFSASQVIK